MICEKKTETDSAIKITWSENLSSFETEDERFSFYGRAAYLDALIAGTGNRGKFYLPVVEFRGDVLAKGCFQELILYKEDLDEMGRLFSSDSKLMLRVEALFKMLVQLGNGRRGIRILIAGNTQVSGSLGLFFNSGVSNALQAEIWKCVIENAEEKWGPFAIILAKEFNLEQEKETIKALKASNLRKISALPVMMMNLDSSWQSFHDYLAAMSAKYRIRAKSARKKGKHISSETWGVEEIALHLDQIEELYENVYSRARFRLMRIDPLYFLRLKQNLGNQFRFQAYFASGCFIGFRTSFCYNNRLDAHLIGLDYEANKEHSLYLNMLYDYVELALENRCVQIDFGRTAMEIKSTVGAEPVDFLPMVKIRNTILNGLTCVLMENSAPEPWIQRHPFREEITTE